MLGAADQLGTLFLQLDFGMAVLIDGFGLLLLETGQKFGLLPVGLLALIVPFDLAAGQSCLGGVEKLPALADSLLFRTGLLLAEIQLLGQLVELLAQLLQIQI